MDEIYNRYKNIINQAVSAGILTEESKKLYLSAIDEESHSNHSELFIEGIEDNKKNVEHIQTFPYSNIYRNSSTDESGNAANEIIPSKNSNYFSEIKSSISADSIENYSILDLSKSGKKNHIAANNLHPDVLISHSTYLKRSKRVWTEMSSNPISNKIIDFKVPIYLQKKKKIVTKQSQDSVTKKRMQREHTSSNEIPRQKETEHFNKSDLKEKKNHHAFDGQESGDDLRYPLKRKRQRGKKIRDTSRNIPEDQNNPIFDELEYLDGFPCCQNSCICDEKIDQICRLKKNRKNTYFEKCLMKDLESDMKYSSNSNSDMMLLDPYKSSFRKNIMNSGLSAGIAKSYTTEEKSNSPILRVNIICQFYSENQVSHGAEEQTSSVENDSHEATNKNDDGQAVIMDKKKTGTTFRNKAVYFLSKMFSNMMLQRQQKSHPLDKK